MLRATTARTFSTAQLPKFPSMRYFLAFWLENASRHNNGTFSIAQLPKVPPAWDMHLDLKMCFAPQRRHFFNSSTSKSAERITFFEHLDMKMCFAPKQRHFFNSSTSKVPPAWDMHLDLKMCFAPQRRHFFNSSTSKSAERITCFEHFDMKMCFAPQRCAFFQPLNFQKCSEYEVCLNILTWKCASHHNSVHFFNSSTSKRAPSMKVFGTVWLENVLRATTACTFSTAQLPKVLRAWGMFKHFDLKTGFATQQRALFQQLNLHVHFFIFVHIDLFHFNLHFLQLLHLHLLHRHHRSCSVIVQVMCQRRQHWTEHIQNLASLWSLSAPPLPNRTEQVGANLRGRSGWKSEINNVLLTSTSTCSMKEKTLSRQHNIIWRRSRWWPRWSAGCCTWWWWAASFRSALPPYGMIRRRQNPVWPRHERWMLKGTRHHACNVQMTV